MINITVGSIIEDVQPVVESDASIRDCIQRMIDFNKGYIVVLKEGKAVGILTERDILFLSDKSIDFSTKCLEYASKELITVSEDKSLYFAINLMMDNNIRRLIVNTADGKFLGSITLKQALFYADEENFKKNLKVRDIILGRNVEFVYSDESIRMAIATMKEKMIGSLPVLDRKSELLVGIITERDILNRVLTTDLDAPVENIMTPNPITISPESSLLEVLSLMEKNSISRLIVVDGDKVIGIINYRDIVASFEKNHKLVVERKLKHAKDLLDLIPDITIEIVDDGENQTVLWTNKRGKAEFGDIIGKPVYTIIPKDYWQVAYSKLLMEKKIQKYRFENFDRVYHLSGAYVNLEDEIGRGRIKLILSDITEEERTLKSVDKELKTYKKIINHAEDLILIYEAYTGKIKLHNDAVMKKLGYTTDELSNMSIFDIVLEDEEIIKKNIDIILRKGSSIKGRRYYKDAYGEKLPVEIVATRVDFNTVPHILIVARDLSERVKFEEEIEKKNFMMRTLTDFVITLNKAVTEREAYDILSHMLMNIVGVDGVIVNRINPSLNRVVESIHFGESIEGCEDCIKENLFGCKVIVSNQPFIVSDRYSYRCNLFKYKNLFFFLYQCRFYRKGYSCCSDDFKRGRLL